MRYEEILPPAALAPFVEVFWRFALDPHDPTELVHVIVPDGAVSLAGIFWQGELVGVELVGPSATAQHATLVAGMTVIGARLCAGAAQPLLDIAPAGHVGQMVLLPADPWAALGVRDGLSGLSDALMQRAALVPPPDALIAEAAAAIEAGATVAAVAGRLGLSTRQLQRRFQRATGLAPKLWQRVRRQRLAWINLVDGHSTSLTDAAHSAGFADSAHFSREARRSFQWSAGEVAAYLGTIAHGPLRRPPGSG